MKLRSRGACALVLAIAAGSLGCSSPAGDPGSGQGSAASSSSSSGDVGALHMQLILPSGQEIEVVSWALTGPNGLATVVQSGNVDSQSLGVSFLVGGIPAASGYSITLSGTATDGSVTCTGAAQFNVAARTTTDVSVELACSVATGGSRVTLVNGTAFDCAGTSGIAASPTETTVGHSVSLHGLATGPAPAALTYQWSAPTGTFDQPTAATSNFECASAGPVTVTLVVGDGPVPSGQSCSSAIDTATAVITCDAVPPSDAGAPGDGGVDAGQDGGGPAAPVPATPPGAVAALCAALFAIGSWASRRRSVGS